MYPELTRILGSSNSIVFFGGAGVSTESGIPDFRSENGLYHAQQKFGHTPEELLSHSFFVRHPDVFFEYYLGNLIYTETQPNGAHKALAELERRGKLRAVITQNIDGLHQKAGSKAVHELHGSIERNYCVSCGSNFTLSYMLHPEQANGKVPLCNSCGGIVRPDVVLYEEALNNEVWISAAQKVSDAEVMIVGGTSLMVYPAAALLEFFVGKKLVLINLTETPYDSEASLVIRDPIGQVFDTIIAQFMS